MRAYEQALEIQEVYSTIADLPEDFRLALVAVGALSLPLAAFRGRGAAVAGLNRIARGAGRIAAEFNLFYDEYR